MMADDAWRDFATRHALDTSAVALDDAPDDDGYRWWLLSVATSRGEIVEEHATDGTYTPEPLDFLVGWLAGFEHEAEDLLWIAYIIGADAMLELLDRPDFWG